MTNLPITGKFNVTCEYGRRGRLWSSGWHKGIDLTCSNRNIYSTCDGVVKTVGWDPRGWGRYVRIQEATTGKIHIFCHLVTDSVRVSVGQTVSRATIIGTMGTTGNSTGVHLHFQIEDGARNVYDPTEWLGIPNVVGSYDSEDYHIDRPEPAPAPVPVPTPGPEVEPTPPPANNEEEEEEVTQAQFNEMMEVYLAEQAKKPESTWSKNEGVMAWAVKNGLIKGDENGNTMPLKFITRQEVAALFKRYDEQK